MDRENIYFSLGVYLIEICKLKCKELLKAAVQGEKVMCSFSIGDKFNKRNSSLNIRLKRTFTTEYMLDLN